MKEEEKKYMNMELDLNPYEKDQSEKLVKICEKLCFTYVKLHEELGIDINSPVTVFVSCALIFAKNDNCSKEFLLQVANHTIHSLWDKYEIKE